MKVKLQQVLALESYAQTVYRKCECCKRVRDIYFRLNVKDAKTGEMLVGSLELCKDCGRNFGEITNSEVATERTIEEFKFE
ncbi:hypothetical protein [Limosilactobacillus panis]|uniref:Uncharacterized protein n=1 Tax=Limosilactobacillus panis DSM 6035 TaxID=1423782 RepID=A0A0R1XT48_9LACO|nr:hypothetical protein [Limosilactobacillus panis]KRM29843.1 hypothetical protein FD32_GL001053 [Limosilactobacillus panis DSM 6035]UUF81115.1 hypothetical protein NO935_23380 [Xanthomonas oryzae pv. oryzae]